jgi:hypothetical protein
MIEIQTPFFAQLQQLRSIATGAEWKHRGNVVNELAQIVPIGNGKPDR